MNEVSWMVAFDDGGRGGNPAPIVLNADALSSQEMQLMARDLGFETAFCLSPTRSDALLRLRYFVPEHEMEMCVHATVAAVSLLMSDSGSRARRVLVETPLRARLVHIDDQGAHVELDDPVVSDRNPPPAQVASVLRVGPDLIGPRLPTRSVSVARPKLMVELPDETTLDKLEPDFEALWDLCDRYGTTGIYAFTLAAAGANAAARQFPRRAGYREDPATGTAAGALAAHLRQAGQLSSNSWLSIAQGRAMGRPSMMTAWFENGNPAPWVGGRAQPLREIPARLM